MSQQGSGIVHPFHRPASYWFAGMEVNAVPSNRRPSTATLPEVASNSARPLSPTMPAKPGSVRSAASVFWCAGRFSADVPTMFPLLSQSVMEIDAATEPAFTIAMAVTCVVSSQANPAQLAFAFANGTTAS